MRWWSKLFGGDKGIVEQVSDVADKWAPSETTKHKMSVEDLKAGDESQASARGMELKSHDTWLDVIVDGWSRLPRPSFATWAFGILVGWWSPPDELPVSMVMNIVWSIITYYFGQRMIFKDIPEVIGRIKAMREKRG